MRNYKKIAKDFKIPPRTRVYFIIFLVTRSRLKC